ncbi:helix-turn-helix transcriptional regulator [Bradyrhizobium sp. STM 3557]|uniref:helix-turn-helix transcriptional regulator n=1 Tax=Bradyrhizobium sp. STM 3557 TaxID=578920 RepID=UPI00388F3671
MTNEGDLRPGCIGRSCRRGASIALLRDEVTTLSESYAQAVEAIYTGFTETDGIAPMLDVLNRLVAGGGATFEVIDKVTQRPAAFHSVGLPSTARPDYLVHFAPLSPRLPTVLAQRPGSVSWDYQILGEDAMACDPFYAEFLPRVGLRYFMSTVVEQTCNRLTVVTIQRTPRQGHVGEREIALMQRLGPHLQRAYQTRMRLDTGSGRESLYEHALDLLSDGVALLRRDGGIVYLNDALRLLASRAKDFRISRHTMEFVSPELRSRFAAALAAVERIDDPSAALLPADFAVPRENGLPPYTISVRPLRGGQDRTEQNDAIAMLLVHDPLQQHVSTVRMLQELYGLTNAEAHLVQALSAGLTAVAYAKSRGVSITTVYTHLKRTREKTGWRSVAELTRRFHELSVSLRAH